MQKFFIGLSIFLALLGVWIGAPRIVLGGWALSDTEDQSLSESKLGRMRATIAARIGIIQGDLWSNDTQIAVYRAISNARSQAHHESASRVLEACNQTLSASPVSSRIWAICSPYCDAGAQIGCAAKFLEMSYFTGPYAPGSIAVRLPIALSLDLNRNPDIKRFVVEDVRFILTTENHLEGVLLSAYRKAGAEDRALVKNEVLEVAPSFLTALNRL